MIDAGVQIQLDAPGAVRVRRDPVRAARGPNAIVDQFSTGPVDLLPARPARRSRVRPPDPQAVHVSARDRRRHLPDDRSRTSIIVATARGPRGCRDDFMTTCRRPTVRASGDGRRSSSATVTADDLSTDRLVATGGRFDGCSVRDELSSPRARRERNNRNDVTRPRRRFNDPLSLFTVVVGSVTECQRASLRTVRRLLRCTHEGRYF